MAGLRIGAAASWLAARNSATWDATSTTLYEAATSTNTTTQAFIYELRFAAAKSVRTSTIILASFNAVAAFATACGILYDAYSQRKAESRKFRTRSSAPSAFIEAAEVYPLILSCGITIQGIVFAVAQAQGLHSFLSLGCTIVSQFLLPAIFLVPYIQLIFALEFVLRGVRRKPFPPRGKYTITICLVILGMLVLANFLVADFNRAPNFCFASLFWFIAVYAKGSFAVLLAIDILLVVSIVLISVRLSRSIDVEPSERVAASRMVFYLALAILSNTLIIPFFFSEGFMKQDHGDNQALNWSMVASVVANVSGLTTGGLHLFLRTNAISTIGPRDKTGEYERRRMKSQIRLYNSSEPDYAGHMMGPVSSAVDLRRILSRVSFASSSEGIKDEEAGKAPDRRTSASIMQPNPLRLNAVHSAVLSTLPATAYVRIPEPAKKPAAAVERPVAVPTIVRTSSSSFATTERDSAMPEAPKSLLLLPATTYVPGAVKTKAAVSSGRFDFSSLMPPPSLSNLMGGRHRRDSSMVSTATVQIGLRLSNLDDLLPLGGQMRDPKVYTLGYDRDDARDSRATLDDRQSGAIEIGTAIPIAFSSPSDPFTASLQPSPLRRPSPLAHVDTSAPSVYEDLPLAIGSPRQGSMTSPVKETLSPATAPEEDLDLDQRGGDDMSISDMPSPLRVALTRNSSSSSLHSSSSSLQSSKSKLPSPRGVGFATVPSRSNTVRTVVVTPTLPSEPRKSVGDWI